MSTKPTTDNCYRKIAAPLKGWRWLVDEETVRGDWFISTFKHILGPVKKTGIYTDGPRINQCNDAGGLEYTVSGYIRRIAP